MIEIKINATYHQLMGNDGTLRKDVRYFEVYGGRRSSKSVSVVQILGLTAITEPDHFIPCIRKVGTTLKDSIFSELCKFFRDANILHEVNQTFMEIRLPNRSRLRCFGLDDPEKLKSLSGATIIWIEEANETMEDDFDSIDAGLSPNKYPGRIVLTHNPVPQIPGNPHWIQKRFLQIEHNLSKACIDKDKNALVLRTWYKDNAFCPKETVKVLEGYKDTNPEKYKLWALGEFTKLEGLVFDNWDIVKEVPEGIESIGVGIDFGFSNDPAAILRIYAHNDELWIKGLLYKTGLTNSLLSSEMSKCGIDSNELITADSAEPKTIEDLRRMGWRSIRGVQKKANYKEDLVNRIRSFKIHLIEGDTDLIREFSTYAWSRDKYGKQLPKLQDGDDHYIDAAIMRLHDYYKHRDLKVGTVGADFFGL